MAIEPFNIEIAQTELDDLRMRLRQTRWPDAVQGADWDYGTNLEYLKKLAHYWATEFDWRAQERELNRLRHFRTVVDGVGLHFIHERGQGPRPLPLLLTHGFPDSFLRMTKLIPLLTAPAAHGADAADSFDVIVPSIPGYGFSDRPTEKGFGTAQIAKLFGALMNRELGYTRFAAHGGDWGSGITEQLARQSASQLVGIHLTDIPYGHLFSLRPDNLSDAEKKYVKAGKAWQMTEGAYAMIQSTKPQTLAFGLNDSPTGLAAWLLEKSAPGATATATSKSVSAKTNCSPTSPSTGSPRPSTPPAASTTKAGTIARRVRLGGWKFRPVSQYSQRT
jgi:pimeloyl-ACP methyl ester carboxylesterase